MENIWGEKPTKITRSTSRTEYYRSDKGRKIVLVEVYAKNTENQTIISEFIFSREKKGWQSPRSR